MTGSDPKQVIIDYLIRPLGEIQPPSPPPPGYDTSKWKSGVSRSGGGLAAKAETIQFLQAREHPHCQLHEVRFEDETGKQDHWLLCIRETTPGSWRFAGGGNVGEVEHAPRRDSAWANLAGGWSKDLFWAGGRVLDNGLDVVRVRLTSQNGIQLEDTVQDGLALFVTDQWVKRPVQVELYDRTGKLVATHEQFKIREPRHVDVQLPR